MANTRRLKAPKCIVPSCLCEIFVSSFSFRLNTFLVHYSNLMAGLGRFKNCSSRRWLVVLSRRRWSTRRQCAVNVSATTIRERCLLEALDELCRQPLLPPLTVCCQPRPPALLPLSAVVFSPHDVASTQARPPSVEMYVITIIYNLYIILFICWRNGYSVACI